MPDGASTSRNWPGFAGKAGKFQRPCQRPAAGLVRPGARRASKWPPSDAATTQAPRFDSLAVTSADATKEICMLYLRIGDGVFSGKFQF